MGNSIDNGKTPHTPPVTFTPPTPPQAGGNGAVRVCPEPVRVGPIALALLAQYEAQYGIVAGPVAPLGKAV